MRTVAVTVIVIAKEPRPGRCKTRLCPPLEPQEAARLAEAALADTLAAAAAADVARRVLLLDGQPGGWLAPGFELVEQSSGGLGDRLAAGFDSVGGPALLIGMDTPQLTPGAIERAGTRLLADGVDAVLGPAFDGGYWAIGLSEPRAGVFDGVPMSSARTADHQRRRLRSLRLNFEELEAMRDFDTIADARQVAASCPGSRFALALNGLRWSAAA